ncbi:hypothetical protein ACOMHN_043762 [Nucella lapillus]
MAEKVGTTDHRIRTVDKDGTADSRITVAEKDGTTDPKFRMTENIGTTELMAEKEGTTEPMAENVGTADLRVRLAEKDGKPLVSGLCDSTGHSVSGRQDGSVDGPQSTWEERTMKTSPDDDDNDDDDTDVVPYDRGWAWMVVLGSVINYALICAHLKTMGVFFVELLHYFHAPASHTALLFAIRGGVSSIAGSSLSVLSVCLSVSLSGRLKNRYVNIYLLPLEINISTGVQSTATVQCCKNYFLVQEFFRNWYKGNCVQ